MSNDIPDDIDDEILSIIGAHEENLDKEDKSRFPQEFKSEAFKTPDENSQVIDEEKLSHSLKYLAATKSSYNRKSFYWGIPGIILQAIGFAVFFNSLSQLDMASYRQEPLSVIFARIVLLLGVILLMVGFAYYAKMKGRSPAWCLVGLLGIIGLLILVFLKDNFVVAPEYIEQRRSPSTAGQHGDFTDSIPVRAKTSKLAVASLILGALSFFIPFPLPFILGIVFGVIAIAKIHSSAGKLRGFVYAITGTVLSCLAGCIFFVFITQL